MIATPTSRPAPVSQASPSVAVVGAGPGGLAAAVLLAASGARVTVFEAGDRVGGRTRRITLHDAQHRAFHFDTGPTFFLMPYVLGEIFAAAGERMEDHVDLTRLDPMYRLIIGRKGAGGAPADPLVIDTTQDLAQMARRLNAVKPGEGEAFDRFIAHNRSKLRLSEPILRRPIRSLLDLVDLETAQVLPLLKPHKSVHQLLGEFFTDEHVKLAVSFQSKYLGMSPFDCPSLFTILPFIEYEYGIWHPKGGCNAMMAALAHVAEKKGAVVRTNTPVERITFSGHRADGVVTGGERTPFDAVVVNADAAWALKNLVPAELRTTGPRREYAAEVLDSKRYSCSTYMLYLGVQGEVDLPHHTIHTSPGYEDNLRDITERGRVTDDPSIYVCNPSRIDPTLAPPGCSALYVLIPTPNCRPGTDGAPINWDTEAPAMRRRAIAQLEEVFGLRDIESRILCEQQITPADWAAMKINHGATFNLAHNLRQMLHWRPQNRLKGFDRLYLVGGGTHPGSGLPTIFLSAQISSALLARDCNMPTAGAHQRPIAQADRAALAASAV